jgi:hypothetical protein
MRCGTATKMRQVVAVDIANAPHHDAIAALEPLPCFFSA